MISKIQKPDIIIGIDPDSDKSGLSEFDSKSRKLSIYSFSFPDLIDYLYFIGKHCQNENLTAKIVVEAGWMNKGNWHIKECDNKRVGGRKGYDVGRNHETGKKICEMGRHYGLDIVEVRPLKKHWKGKDGKITHQELDAILQSIGIGFKKKTNQEERDSILLCLYHGNVI